MGLRWVVIFPDSREHRRSVEQVTQMIYKSVVTLLGGCTEPLVVGKAQGFNEYIHKTSKLRETLAMNMKLLIFRTRNGGSFGVNCLENILPNHGVIMQ